MSLLWSQISNVARKQTQGARNKELSETAGLLAQPICVPKEDQQQAVHNCVAA